MIHCDRKELLNAVQLLSGIIPSKTPKPVLENILFHPSTGSVELVATDLEVGMKIQIADPDIQESEPFLVPGQKLFGILKESEGDKVSFELEDNACKITCGKDLYKVLSLNASEFPQLSGFPEEETFTISPTKLREMIRKTAFSAATEATRYTMNSVLMDIDENNIKMVATDGKRLAYIKTPSTFKKGEYFLLMPTKGIHQLEKTLASEEDDVKVFVQDNQFLIKTKWVMLNIRLLQGTYPPYENVIPKDFPMEVSIDAAELHKALKRASLLTTQESKSVRFEFEGSQLTLYSNDPNVGEAKIPCPMKTEIPEKLEISYNPALVIDVLKVLEGDTLTLELKDSTSPGIIREGADYIYVVMPLNI